jgi:flagellin
MVINTNVPAQNAARLLGESSNLLSKSLSRLSSGSKIVSPADDAAGMAVSMRFDAQVNRVNAAGANISNAISFSQTQDGFLKKVAGALDRMSELAILSQDSTKSDSDRALYNLEFTELKAYVHDMTNKEFNGVSLFASGTHQVTKDEEGNKFAMAGVNMMDSAYTAATGGVTAGTTPVSTAGAVIGTASAAATALTTVKAAITRLATDRAQVGANISRLSATGDQLSVLKDNLAAANSRIKDVNIAEESTQFARFNILVQAGTAMLAQANATPQSALRLLT